MNDALTMRTVQRISDLDRAREGRSSGTGPFDSRVASDSPLTSSMTRKSMP